MELQPRTSCTYMACVHLESDVGNRHARSAKSYKHEMCCVHSFNHLRHRLSASARKHLLWPIHIYQDISVNEKRHQLGNNSRGLLRLSKPLPISQATSTMDQLHHLWLGNITEESSRLAFLHRLLPTHNDQMTLHVGFLKHL